MATSAQITPQDRAVLVAALERALLVAPKARSVDHGLFFQMIALRDSPESAITELRDLHNVIQSVPALEFFDHASQRALGQDEVVSLRFLVSWLISRGQQVGAERSVDDLARYLASLEIELTVVLAVDGFKVKRSIDLDTFKLIAWNDLPTSDTKWSVQAKGFLGGRSPSAALVQRHQVPRLHVRPWDRVVDDYPLAIERALDVLRCVTAVADVGIRRLHYWFEPPEWAPWCTSLSTFGVDSTSHGFSTELLDDVVPRLQDTVLHFLRADEQQRQRCRIPLDRLNRCHVSGTRSVDAAIELGIALESLYAPTQLTDGLSFAIRTRAARFLGGSLNERLRTAQTARDVYDLRSRAIHSGRFDAEGSQKAWRDPVIVRKAIEDGRRLVGRSLVMIIQDGEPNWDELDIEDSQAPKVGGGAMRLADTSIGPPFSEADI